jgi:hypothetical protein
MKRRPYSGMKGDRGWFVGMGTLVAGLLGLTLGGQAAAPLDEVVPRLQALPNYSWTVTTELPGAPFQVAPRSGSADTNGVVVLQSEGGRHRLVSQGEVRFLKVGKDWQSVKSVGAVPAPADRDLWNARTPLAEWQGWSRQLTDLKRESDGSLVGILDAELVRAALTNALAGRTPGGHSPGIDAKPGQVQVWLEDGLPQRYRVTLPARISLPFGSRHVEWVSTTELKDLGRTRVELPPEVRPRLEVHP